MTQPNELLSPNYLTGMQLLTQFGCVTREEKLEQAVLALMDQINDLHIECKGQSLADNVENKDVYCSCVDAYRMGVEALRK